MREFRRGIRRRSYLPSGILRLQYEYADAEHSRNLTYAHLCGTVPTLHLGSIFTRKSASSRSENVSMRRRVACNGLTDKVYRQEQAS